MHLLSPGALTAVQIKIEPKAKAVQQQHWSGGLQAPQIEVIASIPVCAAYHALTSHVVLQVVAVQKHAHEGGVGVLACSKRFAYSIGALHINPNSFRIHLLSTGSSDFVVAMWDLGHGGGTILGDPRIIIIISRSSSSSNNMNMNSAHRQTFSP